MVPQLHVGIDVGCKKHRIGIADAQGRILEEFDTLHTEAGFRKFFHRVDHYKEAKVSRFFREQFILHDIFL